MGTDFDLEERFKKVTSDNVVEGKRALEESYKTARGATRSNTGKGTAHHTWGKGTYKGKYGKDVKGKYGKGEYTGKGGWYRTTRIRAANRKERQSVGPSPRMREE